MHELMKSIQRIDEAIQTYYLKSSDKYSHIDESEIDKIQKTLNEKQTWYDQTANRFNALKKHEDPPILCSQIRQQREVSNHFGEKTSTLSDVVAQVKSYLLRESSQMLIHVPFSNLIYLVKIDYSFLRRSRDVLMDFDHICSKIIAFFLIYR